MQQQTSIPPQIKDEITLREIILKLQKLFRFLLGRWKMIALFIILGGALGLTYALLKKPVYKSQLTFVLENTGKSGASGYASIAAQFGLNLGFGGNGMFQDAENIMALMKSRNMIVGALLSEDPYEENRLLVDRFMKFNDFKDEWKKDKRLSALRFSGNSENNSLLQDSVLNVFYKIILKEHLIVEKPDKKNDIVAVTTIATDELFAKAFTEKLIQNVTSFYIETQTKKSAENVAILRSKTDSVRQILNSALTGVALSTDANPNPNPAFQTLRVPSQKKMVDVEMNKAILEELVKNLELAEITLRKETPLVQVIDHPVLPLEKKKVGKLKGIVVGMFLGGLLTVVFLSLKLFFKKIMQEDTQPAT